MCSPTVLELAQVKELGEGSIGVPRTYRGHEGAIVNKSLARYDCRGYEVAVVVAAVAVAARKPSLFSTVPLLHGHPIYQSDYSALGKTFPFPTSACSSRRQSY